MAVGGLYAVWAFQKTTSKANNWFRNRIDSKEGWTSAGTINCINLDLSVMLNILWIRIRYNLLNDLFATGSKFLDCSTVCDKSYR